MTGPTHALIAIALGGWIVPGERALLQLLIGACCAVLPDIDLLAPYLGGDRDFHRRFTHSATFAVIVALTCAAGARFVGQSRDDSIRLGCCGALAILSHAIADMLTTYPLGVALLSPFSDVRYQLPWHPVTSLGKEAGLALLPALLAGLVVFRIRKFGYPWRSQDRSVTLQLR
jgi:membrane-bound metal-dependent hydrolase YbcI (DUF457 family)